MVSITNYIKEKTLYKNIYMILLNLKDGKFY